MPQTPPATGPAPSRPPTADRRVAASGRPPNQAQPGQQPLTQAPGQSRRGLRLEAAAITALVVVSLPGGVPLPDVKRLLTAVPLVAKKDRPG